MAYWREMRQLHAVCDGIELFRDAASAKRQVFVTENGWFVYNAITQLAAR